jgi:putative nucleotidyltransferase with HDIG domain
MTTSPLRHRELAAVVVLMACAAAAVALAASQHRLVLGLAGLLANLVAVAYMAHLLAIARRRTRRYAALSWGVLSGLLRTLDARDGRAARHAAAVATFSRDIAQVVGMHERDCELAHTAGLLHDIGRFVLADRVMERDADLRAEDWEGIGGHPEVGAALLADLGLYGPVAEIVAAHHERLDGRGYPAGIAGEEIPALARVIAVAEVYDTLTALDTYRTPVSSFEAVRELRRVAGTQLDGRFVEALAELLAGRGTEYRHADAADFDRALEIERRAGDAALS